MNVSEKDYLKAVDIWKMFKMNLMGDYPDLYLKTDGRTSNRIELELISDIDMHLFIEK